MAKEKEFQQTPATPEKERVFLKTVMLAAGCELLGKSGAGALNATGGNTLELCDGFIIAYSAKTRRKIGITYANVKAFEFQTGESNPISGRNRRAFEAREAEARALADAAAKTPGPALG